MKFSIYSPAQFNCDERIGKAALTVFSIFRTQYVYGDHIQDVRKANGSGYLGIAISRENAYVSEHEIHADDGTIGKLVG